MTSDGDGHSIRRFSIQTMLVWIGLGGFLLTVLFSYPGYLQDAFMISVGLYLIHQAIHTRFKHWRGAILIGIVACLIGLISGLLGLSPLQDAIESNKRLRELKEQMLRDEL